jgi:hypothetical protein
MAEPPPLVPGEPPLSAFVSSVQTSELNPLRETVCRVLLGTGLWVPWAFEYTSASAEPADDEYLRHVREADLVIGILTKETTDPVRQEIREALKTGRDLLLFRLPGEAAAETRALIEEIGLRVKWVRLRDIGDIELALKLALTDHVTRRLRGKPRLGLEARLHDLRRQSLARCARRFLASGLSPAEASSLSEDASVGRRNGLTSPPVRPVTVLLGELGAGKSLLLDRWFSDSLSALSADTLSPIPIFLEAKNVEADLRDQVQRLSSGLGDPRSQGIALFLDGLDEVPRAKSDELLEAVRELALSWQNTSVVVGTRTRPATVHRDELLVMPPLAEDEIRQIGLHLSPRGVGIGSALLQAPPSLREAVQRPFFALIFARQLRDNAGRRPSTKGDLIRDLVTRSLRLDPELESRLARLAVLAIDQGGTVLGSEVGDTSSALSLLGTGLVSIDEQGALSFSLRILSEWFGAVALSQGLVSPDAILSDPLRKERWKQSLIEFVGNFPHESVSLFLSRIARADPGLASECVNDAIPDYRGERGTMQDPSECGRRIRESMRIWVDGLKPVSDRFSMVTPAGLAPLAVSVDEVYLGAAWYGGREKKPEVFPFPLGDGRDAFLEESLLGGHLAAPPPNPAWAWRWSLGDVRSELNRILKARQLPVTSESSIAEDRWQTTLLVTGRGTLSHVSISLDEIESRLSKYSDTVCWINGVSVDLPAFRAGIQRLRDAELKSVDPPWPGPDQGPGPWVSSGYSRTALLSFARAVYAGAIETYEAIVAAWFPSLAGRLWHAATLPAVLKGRVLAGKEEPEHAPWLWYQMEPLSRPGRSRVEFILGESGFSREEHSAYVQHFRVTRGQEFPWLFPRMVGTSLWKLWGVTPARDLAYEWLTEDLKRLGLL